MELTKFDSAEYLDIPEAIDEFLKGAFEDGDPAFIAHAFGIAARAYGMTDLAKKTGLSRQVLYKAFNENGNPEFATVLKVAEVLGYKLTINHAA